MDVLNQAINGEGEQQPEVVTPEVVETTGEQVEATPAAPVESEEQRQAHGFQAAMLAERQKRQKLELRLAELERPKQPEPVADGAPNPDDYQDNPREYWRLLARHEARQELNEAVAKAQQAAKQTAEQERTNKTLERLAVTVTQGQSKYRDFDAVINGGLAPFLSDAMREELASSDLGADLAYYLGKNPGEAAKLAQLPERALAREIVRLESKVQAPIRPQIPQTLTQERDARGQFKSDAYDGPTPLDAILSRK